MRPLNPRERRLLAIGLLLGALAVVWLAIIAPLVGGFFDRAAERRQLLATYQRNQRIMAAIPVWRAGAGAQRARAPRFAINAPSEQLAVEILKERLLHLATDEGFTINAMQDLQANAPAGKVRVRADLQLSLTQLYESLRRLETEGSYVVVEYLSISADRAFQTGRLSPGRSSRSHRRLAKLESRAVVNGRRPWPAAFSSLPWLCR